MTILDQRGDAVRWVRGVLALFTLYGLIFGTWLSRLPAIRDHLGASTAEMSVFLLAVALGSLTGLVLSGHTVTWLGPRRTLFIGLVTVSLAMPLVGTFFWIQTPLLAAAALAVFGFAFSTSDVAINVSGANAERALGLPRMPLFHGGYSLGTVAAMLIGTLTETLSVPVPLHFAVAFALFLAVGLTALRALPRNETAGSKDKEEEETAPADYRPWRDPRVYAIGLIALSMALSEGVAADWLPLALIDGRGMANERGTLVLGVFLGCMTLARVAGSWLLLRFGRVLVLRGGALLVLLGLVLVILVPAGWAIILGAALWGLGSAFGFPVAISAAADNPRTAVRSVAAVSVIAYGAYLVGPLSIGFLGEHLGLLQAFWVLALFAALSFVLASAARPPR